MKSQNNNEEVLQHPGARTAGSNSYDGTTALELVEPSQEAVNIARRQDIAPDGGYGWVCTACVFMINAHTWGVNSVSMHIDNGVSC